MKTNDLIEQMTKLDWASMDFKERYQVIEELTQEVYYDYGEKGRVAPLGYDIDDAQFIVWRAYEDALMSGKIRLGLI